MSAGFTIPCGTCTECDRELREGETAKVILYAGSAWKDGVAELRDGAELYTARVLCPDCAPLYAEAANNERAYTGAPRTDDHSSPTPSSDDAA